MSIQIIEQPAEIVLSKNPIIHHLKTDALYNGENVYIYFDRKLNRAAFHGEGFGFSFLNPKTQEKITLDFTAVPDPDDSGNYYYDNSYSGPQSDSEMIISYLRKNKVLNTFYTVEMNGSYIRFTAKYPTTDFIPTDTEIKIVTGGGVHVGGVIYNGYGVYKAVKHTNFRVLISVFFEREYLSDEWDNVATLKELPSDNGDIIFDISDILNSELESTFVSPPLSDLENNIILPANLLRRYYIAYIEKYDDLNDELTKVILEKRTVHYGGVSIDDYSNNNIFDYLQGHQKFLSWSTNKKLHTNQKEWLSWMNYTNKSEEFFVFLKIYVTNNATTTINLGTVKLDKWQTLVIPAGYNQRNIAAIVSGLEVYKWSFQIKSFTSGLPVSEEKFFTHDCKTYLCSKELVYLNSFNVPESILTVGEWTKSLNVKREYAERTLSHNYLSINGQNFQFNAVALNTFKARTGYIDKPTADYFQEVLIQNHVFLIDDSRYIPILIKAKSVKIDECLTFLNQIDFKVEKSTKIKSYSKEIATPKLKPIYNCGVKKFEIVNNINNIQIFGDLKIYDGTTLLETVNYNATDKLYTLTNALVQDLNYSYSVDFTTIIGNVIKLNKHFNIEIHKVTLSTRIHLIFRLYLATFSTPQKTYVDFGDSNTEQLFTITNALSIIQNNYVVQGTKSVKLYVECKENIKIFKAENSRIINVDINSFPNLEIIIIIGYAYPVSSTLKNFNVKKFSKATVIQLINTNYENVTIGVHPKIQDFTFTNCLLQADTIERLLLDIWKYRKLYSTLQKTINIIGNPGAGLNITPIALSIINGTGIYLNEGLQTDYNFNVLY